MGKNQIIFVGAFTRDNHTEIALISFLLSLIWAGGLKWHPEKTTIAVAVVYISTILISIKINRIIKIMTNGSVLSIIGLEYTIKGVNIYTSGIIEEVIIRKLNKRERDVYGSNATAMEIKEQNEKIIFYSMKLPKQMLGEYQQIHIDDSVILAKKRCSI